MLTDRAYKTRAICARVLVKMLVWCASEPSCRWLGATPSPTADEAAKALQGDPSALAKSAWLTLTRAAVLGIGMMAVGGTDLREIAKQSLAASALVEAFVFAWAALTKRPDGSSEGLPSMAAADGFHDDPVGGIGPLLGTMAIRSLFIGGGIALAGEHDLNRLFKKTLGSVVALEAVILAGG